MGKNLILHIKKFAMDGLQFSNVKIKTLSEGGIWVPNCRKELLISGRWNIKPLLILKPGRDSYTNGDSQLYKIFLYLCPRHEPRAHIWNMVLSLSDTPNPSITFQAADSNFFL